MLVKTCEKLRIFLTQTDVEFSLPEGEPLQVYQADGSILPMEFCPFCGLRIVHEISKYQNVITERPRDE